MNNKINALYLRNDEVDSVEIFGYSTKGLPGLEIVNMGKFGRTIKEKFIYLSRSSGVKLPMRRYVLCIEDESGGLMNKDNYRWIELPLLLLFWSLAKHIPISRLDNCYASGKISLSGKISSLPLTHFEQLDLCNDQTILAPMNYKFSEFVNHIPLERVIPSLYRILPETDYSSHVIY